jgi:predicted Zn-dependent protease
LPNLHFRRIINGDKFQVGNKKPYLIENGEYAQTLKGGMVSGKALDLIKNISGISNQQFIESGATAFSCITPYIRSENVQVVGK